jgi:nucleoside-diphosphate-sugar epimerase
MYQQLFSSLEIDNTKAKTMLNWQPPYSARDALKQAGREYVNNGS